MATGRCLRPAALTAVAEADEAEVEPPVVQGAKLLAAVHVEEIDGDGGQSALEGGEGRGQEVVEEVGDVANAQGGRFVPAQALDRIDDLGAEREDAFRVDEEGATFFGKADVLFRAIEETHAEFFLQVLNLPGERGLGEVKVFGAFRKAESFGDSDKITEVSEFHDRELLLFITRRTQFGQDEIRLPHKESRCPRRGLSGPVRE